MELFYFTSIFSRLRLVRCHRTGFSTSFISWDHFWFKNSLVLLLIITFTCSCVYFLMFYRNLCWYKALLLNYWTTPTATIFFSSCPECNIPLITIHCCSNESISNIDFRHLIKALDLAHCDARTVLTSVWKQRYYFSVGGSVDEYGVVVVVIVSSKQEEL